MKARTWLAIALAAWTFGLGGATLAQDYRPADQGQRPAASPSVLPEQFLRGYDPVTVYFGSERGPGPGPADDGEKLLEIRPRWPGAWIWLDRKSLQFRPAEPWPALARFQIKAAGKRHVLSTVMAAPMSMSPADGAQDLRPFRSFQLVFAQALPLADLKKMIELEVRELPGLKDSPRRKLTDFSIALSPRRSHREPATYNITLDEPVPEGHQLQVGLSLSLGEVERMLWTGRLSTRPVFHLSALTCGGARLDLRGSAKVPKEMALACGHSGETPQLVFSAPVAELSLTQLKRLVRLEPSVPGLNFETFGSRVVLKGPFKPDVLYRMQLADAAIEDDSGRRLENPGEVEAFFFLGWRQPFLRWQQANGILEARGPRMMPVVGYGEPRVDLRVHRVDPLHKGLWPFPSQPVVVNEDSPPPFPGEEPANRDGATDFVSSAELQRHLRLLGSPLVSKVVELPLADRSQTTHLGLDLGPLLDEALGANRPGHYLVGLRRMTGAPERSFVRVQVTNLSLTTVEERGQVVFYVRSIDKAEPVGGAEVVIEVVKAAPKPAPGQKRQPPAIESLRMRTDARGRAVLASSPKAFERIYRVYVRRGEDLLLINPDDAPPRFANNHWSSWGRWLDWLRQAVPTPANDRLLGFIFTERAIYRPGEKVFIKGYVREEVAGRFRDPGPAENFAVKIRAPGGKEWIRPVSFTELRAFELSFEEKDAPTGSYSVQLLRRKPRYEVLASRSFRIEAYRIPKFELQLSGPERVANDAPFDVKAVARYYAGGSVSNQPIQWTVTRRPYHHLPKGLPGFLFASSLQFSREGRVRPPETRNEQRQLSVGGADLLNIKPQLDMDGSARIYRVEATVTGVDNQQVSALHETRALPPFVLGMKLDRFFDKPGVLKPEVLAVGVDDKPVAGQKVTVRLYRRVWHSHLRETDFASGEASYVTEQEDVKIQEVEISTAAELVRPTLELAKSGVYLVELLARDRLGRVQSLSADLFVGGKDAVAWSKPSQGVFELSSDKKKYEPGETAKLILKSPFQEGVGLIIIENPGGNRHEWVQIRGGQAVVSVPIGPEHLPNLPVHAMIMRGRIGQGGDDARYRPRTLAASLDLEVKPTAHTVEVRVSHPKTVRPGSTVQMKIELSDDRKRPVAGEVTLWLVDEAVLALAHEASLDPLDTMIQRNRQETSLRDTRNKVIGRLAEREEPAGDGGEDADERNRGKRRVRKNFQTVPYYQATLKVPRSGVLLVPVTVSDDLTNFQVRAVAVSGLERFGLRKQRLRVRLPVIVQPMLPRFVRQGDEFMAGGIGRLVEGAEGEGQVAIKVDGSVQARSFTKSIRLERNKAEPHLWPLAAVLSDPSQPGSIRLRMDIQRAADGVGDAFEVSLPVLPDRALSQVAWFERWKSGKHALKDFPEKPRAGTVRQEILVSSVPGVMELMAGLDYLAAYPHGCLEQQMSSLMAQLQIGAVLERLGLNQHYALQVREHVERILETAALYQDEQGFFAFWPGGQGDVALTAQALEMMAVARRLNIPVSQKLYSRSIAALKRVLRSDFTGLMAGYRFNQQTAAMRALTLVGELDENYLIDMFHHKDSMDLTSVADMTLSMKSRPAVFRTNLPALAGHLWSRVVFKLHRGKPVYQGLRWSRQAWGEGYLGSQISTLAAVFEALLRIDGKNDKIELLRGALLAQASAERGFGNTHANRRAIAALLAYLEEATVKDIPASVSIGDEGRLELGGAVKVARRELKHDGRLSVEVDSSAELGARIRYSYLPDASGDQVAPLAQGFIVDRTTTVMPKAGGPARHFADEVGAKRKLALGDIVEIEARIVSEQDQHHVALRVPFAAGLEPLNPALKTAGAEAAPSRPDSLRASYVQRLDHELRYYFTHLPRGTHRFYFRLRAATPGSYVHPAIEAEKMYAQDTRGRGAGMRIEVSPSASE